ncbi:MAG: class I SAM-dependent methyltransferase [Planctomycetales bacterium]|nr:class I SAM-dependent methyltransferase [Planctomycetales bacterium]
MNRVALALKSRIKAFLLHKLRIQVRRVPRREEQKFPVWMDSQFPRLYRKYCAITMVPWQGLYWSWLAAKYIEAQNIPGDVVECGVYKGGCSLLMAEAHDREVWMYDTYSGMAEPGEFDFKGTFKGERFDARNRYLNSKKDGHVDWVYESLENVKQPVDASGIAPDRFNFVVGEVEDTIPGNIPERIALLRLDTDFYASTKHELEHLYPRLSNGGILIVDDFGSWAGSRKAVLEYLDGLHPLPLAIPESSSGSLLLLKPNTYS